MVIPFCGIHFWNMTPCTPECPRKRNLTADHMNQGVRLAIEQIGLGKNAEQALYLPVASYLSWMSGGR